MKMYNTIMERLAEKLPVLIAEAGVNYYDIAVSKGISLMEAAKLMILEARNAGVHAIKFQSYKASELAAKVSPMRPNVWISSKINSVSNSSHNSRNPCK